MVDDDPVTLATANGMTRTLTTVVSCRRAFYLSVVFDASFSVSGKEAVYLSEGQREIDGQIDRERETGR